MRLCNCDKRRSKANSPSVSMPKQAIQGQGQGGKGVHVSVCMLEYGVRGEDVKQVESGVVPEQEANWVVQALQNIPAAK